jgi:hypothetical protein
MQKSELRRRRLHPSSSPSYSSFISNVFREISGCLSSTIAITVLCCRCRLRCNRLVRKLWAAWRAGTRIWILACPIFVVAESCAAFMSSSVYCAVDAILFRANFEVDVRSAVRELQSIEVGMQCCKRDYNSARPRPPYEQLYCCMKSSVNCTASIVVYLYLGDPFSPSGRGKC